jgi:hypothetical protein
MSSLGRRWATPFVLRSAPATRPSSSKAVLMGPSCSWGREGEGRGGGHERERERWRGGGQQSHLPGSNGWAFLPCAACFPQSSDAAPVPAYCQDHSQHHCHKSLTPPVSPNPPAIHSPCPSHCPPPQVPDRWYAAA